MPISATITLRASQHATRVRVDAPLSTPTSVIVQIGETSEVWPAGTYIEIVRLPTTLATVVFVPAANAIVNQMSGTTVLEQGEYARVSLNPNGTWDLHIYKIPVAAVSLSIPTAADSGSGVLTSTGPLTIIGNATQGISTSATNSTFAVSAVNASTNQKGVASFNPTHFSAAAGAVSLSATLGALTNVTAVDAAATDSILTKSAGNWVVATRNAVVGSTSVDAHNDVTLSALSDGDTLMTTSGQFINRKISYLHVQPVASNTWVVNHGLGQQYCTFVAVNNSNAAMTPTTVVFNSSSRLTASFTAPVAGKLVVVGTILPALPPLVVSSFTFSPTSVAPAAVVSFTDTSTNSPTFWEWAFGDGSTSSLKNPTYAYASAGSFTVTLTASNGGGTGSSATATVSVVAPVVSTTTILDFETLGLAAPSTGTPVGTTYLASAGVTFSANAIANHNGTGSGDVSGPPVRAGSYGFVRNNIDSVTGKLGSYTIQFSAGVSYTSITLDWAASSTFQVDVFDRLGNSMSTIGLTGNSNDVPYGTGWQTLNLTALFGDHRIIDRLVLSSPALLRFAIDNLSLTT